jgi:glycosyltransferase involved in cell wall biosynthesis
VEFTGFRDDVNQLLQKMDIVVHASTTPEPFGQVVTEGMAAGKPVVATRGGGVVEIVEDGETGFLVPMGDAHKMADAVCSLLESPERAREMGIKGRERVHQQFSIQRSARMIESVYGEVIDKRPMLNCGIAKDGQPLAFVDGK